MRKLLIFLLIHILKFKNSRRDTYTRRTTKIFFCRAPFSQRTTKFFFQWIYPPKSQIQFPSKQFLLTLKFFLLYRYNM
jgi:hypothetical protein